MYDIWMLSVLAPLSIFAPSTQANPLPESVGSSTGPLSPRNNDYNLKCSNSGNDGGTGFIAGAKTFPSSVENWPRNGTSFRATGSQEVFMKYLMCTPGTETYTFFNNGRMDPDANTTIQAHSVSDAISASLQRVNSYLASNEDGSIDGDAWTATPKGTNIQVWVQSSNGTMTWGIWKSALVGFDSLLKRGYNWNQNPMVFQVNDGQWGETGIGYAGYVFPESGKCIYATSKGTNFDCDDVKKGKVIR